MGKEIDQLIAQRDRDKDIQNKHDPADNIFKWDSHCQKHNMPEDICGQDHPRGGLQEGPDCAKEFSHCLLILKQNQTISQSGFCFSETGLVKIARIVSLNKCCLIGFVITAENKFSSCLLIIL